MDSTTMIAWPALVTQEGTETGVRWWLFGILVIVVIVAVVDVRRRRTLRARLLGGRPLGHGGGPEFAARAEARESSNQSLPEGGIDRWLLTAGYDGDGMRTRFFLWMAAAGLLGAFSAIALEASGLIEQAVIWIEGVPGGIAEVFAPVMRAATWILGVLVALIPIVWVRRRRSARMEEVERDLPSVLSLLATLVESGLGFDAAALRVERSLGEDRILAQELARVRAGTLSGMSRAAAFRAMAHRLDVPSMTAFSSALIHAESQGASVGETLRRQAVDLWGRRREEAIHAAQSLPTKLAFPLVICFLPGVFVWTFGPAVAEFIRLAGNAISGNL
ncbi:MAG: type II secretion system F family protein [Planctomycetota bacterium]